MALMSTAVKHPGLARVIASRQAVHPAWDRSETRPVISQRRPGRFIGELAGRHRGACAIFFNGKSLGNHDLHKIKVPTIGMNRTYVGFKGYDGPQPDYYCYVDINWIDVAKRLDQEGSSIVVNGSTDNAAIGYRATRSRRMSPFSFDLARDGYVDHIPCTTGHLALQLAAYLGFTDIYCLGLDMGGNHFDGTRSSWAMSDARAYHAKQAPVIAEKGIRVSVCGNAFSECKAFAPSTFDELCAQVPA